MRRIGRFLRSTAGALAVAAIATVAALASTARKAELENQLEAQLDELGAQIEALRRDRMGIEDLRRLARIDAPLDEATAAKVATVVLAGSVPDDDRETKAYLARHHPQLLRDSLAYWMRYAAGMEVGPHHLEWSELLPEHSHLALLAARGHGKSAFWSFAYPLWKSWREPNTRGFLISNTESQVASLMRHIKDGKSFVDADGRDWTMPQAASLPILADIIPKGWERTWTTERIFFTNGSAFEAKTFGKSFRGGHVQWIVVDDPLKDNSQYSALDRQKSKDFLHRTISKMLLPARGAQMVVIGTPMHGDDLHADLRRLHEAAERRGRKRGDWFQRSYPGHWKDARTGEDRYLWPSLRGPRWHAREREANELAYIQEIELRPVSDETSLFPADLFYRNEQTMQANMVMRPSKADIAAAGWSVYMGVDLAISAEVGADYTVIVVLAVDEQGNRYLIDLERMHGASYAHQVDVIKATARRYGADLVVIEANQMQVVFADNVRRTTDIPVRAYTTGAEKHTLRRGVPSLRPLIENGKLRLPRGDEYSVQQTNLLLSELRDFGFVDGQVKGIGNHDDCVMALWLCDQAVRGGASFGFNDGTEEGEGEELEGEEAEDGEALEGWGGFEAEAAKAAKPPKAANPIVAAADVADDAQEVIARMVADDRASESKRIEASKPPRLNVAAVQWRLAAQAHPDGVEGVRRDCARMPADITEHVKAWNAISRRPPNLADVDEAFRAFYLEHGEQLLRAVLRDVLKV